MRCAKLFYLGMLSLLFASPLWAADWPQWLGPNRDGSSAEKVGPWKGELKEAWKKPVGEGNSSPIVADGLVYLHVKVKDKDTAETVMAFDAKTGDMKWEQTYEKAKFKPLFGAGPRSTPAVADGRLFTLGNTGVLAAWEAKTGKPLWSVDLLKEYKVPNLFFGISSSPIVEGDKVIVMIGKGMAVGAFNVADGKLAWKAGEDPASYASPIAVGKGDARQLVFLTGANLMGVSLKGDIAWKYPFVDKLNESSTTPVKIGKLYIASSVTAGAVAVELKEEGGKTEAKQVWKNPKLTCYFSTPSPVGADHIYLVTGAASFTNPSVSLRCAKLANGEQIWEQTKIGKYHAALLKLGDGKMLLHSDNGYLKLLAPNTEKYEELASSKICGDTWAHPALVNGLLYVRDGKDLICLELPKE